MYWAEKTRCFRQRKSSCSWNRYFCRPPRPWDSSGKNIGVGCHFLLQCMKVKSESEVAQSCPTFSDPMDWSLLGSSVHEWGAIAFSDNCDDSRYFICFEFLIYAKILVVPFLLNFLFCTGAQIVKNLSAMWETSIQSLGCKDPLEEGIATHSNILAWRFPWTEEPGGLQSMGSQRVGHDWVINIFTFVRV